MVATSCSIALEPVSVFLVELAEHLPVRYLSWVNPASSLLLTLFWLVAYVPASLLLASTSCIRLIDLLLQLLGLFGHIRVTLVVLAP